MPALKNSITPRVGRLRTSTDVVRELGRLYRSWRRGDMDDNAVKSGTYVLTQLRQAIETRDFEDRLDAIEEAVNAA